jgi:ligand-binding SRPBCC domain-containing protein
MHSLSYTQEKAVAGVVTGLIGADQEVSWRARHFGIWFSVTSRITAFRPPGHFRDSMKRGPFKRFDHDHFFEFNNGATVMRETFDYTSPFGLLGNIVDSLILERYMTALLTRRNVDLKRVAETNPNMFLKTI